jgi:4-hydroxy-tetrahydrodipicolinate synthase
VTAGIERLEGVWTIVPTPFRPDGALDIDSLPTLTRFIAGHGVDGMTILGVLGEAGRLGDDERDAVIGGVLAAAADLPVCIGVSHAGTDRAVAFARRAEAAGAHSVMLAPPALARPNDAAVIAHYRAVADAIAIPVVVQDHPASSGVTMTVDVLATIAEASPSCRVIKLEDEPSPPKVGRLMAARSDLRVLGGLGGIMLLEELRRGAAGTMTGFGFPELLVEIVGRFRAGDEAPAQATFHRIMPLIRFENQPGLNLAIRKHIYRRRGAITSERLRAPAPTLDPGTIADLDAILEALDLADRLTAA